MNHPVTDDTMNLSTVYPRRLFHSRILLPRLSHPHRSQLPPCVARLRFLVNPTLR